MAKLNENTIEHSFVNQLVDRHGYEYFYGPDIAPYSDNQQRDNFESVVLEKVLKESIDRLNPSIPESARKEAYQKVLNLGTTDIMENNKRFHNYITNGVVVEYTEDGSVKGVTVKLIDIENINKNKFWAVNQLVVRENNNEKRYDVVVYVNGLPLVFIELKNAIDEKATLHKAYTQIQNYKTATPSIFYYNSLTVISDGIDARVSSLSAPYTRYLVWKSPNKDSQEIQTELQILGEHMLKPNVLLNLIRYCTVFESEEKKDEKTGLKSIVKIKKVAAYHQYYAVEKAVTETVRATNNEDGDRKVGVVWHTQGSGKSLSMVFYAGQVITHPEMKNPTLVILTDRNDLDDQLFGTFGNCQELLRQKPVQATSRENLKELLNVSGGGVIFTTIQKFAPAEGNVFDTLSERSNIVVVADEAHRSQYGFSGRVVETEEGSEIRYGNAKYIRDAIPHASYIGFTGTPIEKEDKSTLGVFGDYIDIYDIKQAVDDGATVPISYESRLVKIKMNEEVATMIDAEIESIDGATPEQIEKAKKKNAGIEIIVGHPDRISDIAKDMIMHFEARQEVFEGKAMFVAMSRQICVDVYDAITALRPDWHSDDLNKGVIKVIMTSSSDDPASFQPHHTTKQQRKDLAIRIKDPHDELKIVIVRDMWLTGFDAPSLHTMYVDKKMQGANLMQAIARVNRVYKDKPGGLIVDYIGIGQDLRAAMAVYLQSGGEGESIVDIAESIAGMKEKFEIIDQMFHGFEYEEYFKAEVGRKLQVLLGAQNFILENDGLRDRFLKEISLLSKLFAMSIPSDEANAIKDYIAFFQAVQSRINKFEGSGIISDRQVDTAVKQIVDEALASDGVVDIFQAAGIKTPSVSILSDEFLLEVKNMQQKNVAFELLKKLLSDEVRLRKTKNITQGKKFSEMLESIIKRYHNNQIDSAQVLEELSGMAREMRLEDNKAKELGLTSEEYAFYTVLAENQSTSMLNDQQMKELIHMVTETVRNNATIDWEKMESKRATLRLAVKKILMKYGYPPDLARIEADRVLAQSELLARELRK
jgi:type I restriction enzyme R subunit